MNDRPNQLPKARKEKLIVKELPDEILVYDRARDEAHCLNRTAGLVWQECDGKTGVTEIAKSLGEKTQTVADERVVWLALDELEKFKLLENSAVRPNHLAGMNRRQLVRSIGFAALALPAISSMAAPPAPSVVSCPPPGCVTPGCIPSGCPCSPNGNNPLCPNPGSNCTGNPGVCQ